MKKNCFLWGWNGYAPTVDKLMTRQRAARLLLSWRRSKTQGQRNFSLCKIGPHHYNVSAIGYDDRAVLIIT